jgi:hypothetical protein
MCLYRWSGGCGFRTKELQRTRGRRPEGLIATYPGRWSGRFGQTAWYPRTMDLIPIFHFPCGDTRKMGLIPMFLFLCGGTRKSILRIIEDIVAILHAAVINADARMLRHIRGNTVRCAVICLELDYCNNEVSMVWSHDSFCYLLVMCMLKTKHLTAYVFNVLSARDHTLRRASPQMSFRPVWRQ